VIQISEKKLDFVIFVYLRRKTFVIKILYISGIHHQLIVEFYYMILLNT
jgi:hypothetical protein